MTSETNQNLLPPSDPKNISGEDRLKLLDYLDNSDDKKGFITQIQKDKANQIKDTIEDRFKKEELKRYTQDTLHRSTLIVWAGVVVSVWLLSVLLILTMNYERYKLSDTVLITLLGTTTINVLGLMIIVLNDLFNKLKKEKKV